MKKIWVACGFISLFSSHTCASFDDHRMSISLHGLESLVGNYGFTTSVKVARHVEITVPVEFYSFSHSLPGKMTLKIANEMAAKNGISALPRLHMKHFRAGVGVRLFIAPSALNSGFYFQPILYGGWIQNSDFTKVEFNSSQEMLSAVNKTIYNDLPVRNYFALTPQLNIGYQLIFDWGIMAQIAAYGNYIFAPGIVSIFDASDRFFSSRVVPDGTKSQIPQNTLAMLHTLGTQMPGWHGGIVMNLGMAF